MAEIFRVCKKNPTNSEPDSTRNFGVFRIQDPEHPNPNMGQTQPSPNSNTGVLVDFIFLIDRSYLQVTTNSHGAHVSQWQTNFRGLFIQSASSLKHTLMVDHVIISHFLEGRKKIEIIIPILNSLAYWQNPVPRSYNLGKYFYNKYLDRRKEIVQFATFLGTVFIIGS